MVEKEELVEKFEITGCKNISDEILEKCVELCHWFNKDEEEFMDMWVAFGINHRDGNLEPTLQALEEMKFITPRNESRMDDDDEELFETQEQHQNLLNTSNSNAFVENENDILGIYASSEVLSLMTKKSRSPDPAVPSTSGCKMWPVECAPATLEPVAAVTTAAKATATQSISSRSSTPGNKVLIAVGPKVKSWTNKNKDKKFVLRRVGPHIPPNARYMFELLKTTSEIRTRVCRATGMRMNSLWSEQKKDKDMIITWNVRAKHQKTFRTWGRICFESEDKTSTVLLEGCKLPPRNPNCDTKFWPEVELDCTDLRECCLFPGQIIAVEGLNLTESLLKVRDIYTGTFIPAAKPPQLTDNINILIAAGPFTQSNDLDYQPLWELMAKIAEDEPHIVILIGPFIDHTHPRLLDPEMNCTFRDFFLKLVSKIGTFIAGKSIQVVLIASSRDAHHHPVFPTPEYIIPKSAHNPQIFVLPDPCYLDIEGLRLGITSIDCLMHIGREEIIIKPSATDKFSRLGSYILNQACFYPLYPSAKEANVDSELWEKYAFLHERPHILILPSDMRYFCKHINETVILNPERLCKRLFARVHIEPCKEEDFSVQKSVSCEVIKM